MREYGRDFQKDAEINKKALDEECVLQPLMYSFYAEANALARNKLDVAKNNLDATEARRALYYRRNPPTDIKVTEAVMESLVADDREVQDAKDALSKAQAEVNLLYATMATMDQRRASVDNLVKLQLSKYYGTGEVDTSRDRLKNGTEE